MASAPVYKTWGVDGTPLVGNSAAVITSGFDTMNGTTFDPSTGAPNGQRCAYVRVYRSALSSTYGVYENGYLDSTAWEGNLAVFNTGTTTTPDGTGTLSRQHPGGAQVIWLPDGSLVAIYRTRTGAGQPWQHWWRINRMAGEQQLNYDQHGHQGTYGTVSPYDGSTFTNPPPVSSGVMGNWSAREGIALPTSEWCQVARGQDRVVALYSLGTLTQSDRRVVLAYDSSFNYLEDPRTVYSRTLGDLCCMYALDSECKTWSAPILIDHNVSPLCGGICYTGAEWICCYMDAAGKGVLKRTANLLDWSAGSTFTNIQRPADTSYSSYPHQIPAKELFCYGLAYDAQRNLINGLWSTYDDSAQQYYTGANNPAGNPIHSSIWYGWYDTVVSSDQGQTWRLALPYSRSNSVAPALDGGAFVVNEIALLRDPAHNGSGVLQHSYTGFQLDNGLLVG